MESFFSFILYPVSAILWFWHKIFGAVLGEDNGFAWALAVFFLVFTLRVVLLKPAISQMRAGRKMAKFAPHIQKLRDKYKNDRQRMAQEMQKLQSEHGVNPLGGCLPALLQIPVFLSLFHVLRNFHPGAESNFIFDKAGVDSFINASIFGAKLSNWITQPEQELALFGTDRTSMMIVGIPLMIIASVATFFTMRLSMKKQTDAAMANPQSAMMAKFMMYVAPIGAIISGWFLPIAVLLYWLANNIWTLGQQHFLTKKIDREQEREKAKEIEAKKAAPRPKPGQKPVRQDGKDADEESASTTTTATKPKSSTNGQRQGSRQGAKKNRPGKQAASAKKGKKRR
ncbi:YidC/Oxa1 family membrane protein insertase [Saccharopolyspora antimicrobica]|uniref:Membrane protein insertase YidC n=1 Tax=Saccharopolyspora antimicrobica TaxID=455193 RepID=A0A1I4ZR70_9PSEU|nr:membrane protein insertase YidC [Saccharopolyspora antimicrobica]RKT83432.1 YidC/Oxa1 family membrane protein insertase [Saccharopolyspora antimicrobica]SFN52766.1 YidC/Oxa1 family membrane protein insertase [Saccharopolyspora antimicrobica]